MLYGILIREDLITDNTVALQNYQIRNFSGLEIASHMQILSIQQYFLHLFFLGTFSRKVNVLG